MLIIDIHTKFHTPSSNDPLDMAIKPKLDRVNNFNNCIVLHYELPPRVLKERYIFGLYILQCFSGL
jgi:hypothetical protein